LPSPPPRRLACGLPPPPPLQVPQATMLPTPPPLRLRHAASVCRCSPPLPPSPPCLPSAHPQPQRKLRLPHLLLPTPPLPLLPAPLPTPSPLPPPSLRRHHARLRVCRRHRLPTRRPLRRTLPLGRRWHLSPHWTRHTTARLLMDPTLTTCSLKRHTRMRPLTPPHNRRGLRQQPCPRARWGPGRRSREQPHHTPCRHHRRPPHRTLHSHPLLLLQKW